MLSMTQKLNQLNRKMKTSDFRSNLATIQETLPQKELLHLVGLAKDVKDTPLEGMPFLIASLKAKLKTEKEIADIISSRTGTKVSVGAIQKCTQLPGFTNLVTQMMPGIWQDLTLMAQATIAYHLQFRQDVELAKWLLESTGQVASSRPLAMTDNRTVILNGGAIGPGNAQNNQMPTMSQSIDQVAMGIMNRLTQNIKISETEPPPTVISQ